MREVFPLNRDWLFIREDAAPSAQPETVELPHANTLLPYNYLDETAYQFVSVYTRTLYAPEAWRARRVFVRFEGVMAYAEVFCNDAPAGAHKGGYTPFTVELTHHLRIGAENTLRVRVDSTERPDIPPCGNVVDYLTYGGIYREASLIVTEPSYIRSVQVSPRRDDTGETAQVAVRLGETLCAPAELRVQLTGNGEDRIATLRLPAGADAAEAEFPHAEALRHWSPEDPALYTVTAELYQENLKTDAVSTRFGMRFCQFRPDGFYLNGKRRKLHGLNRHQSFPYVGYAMPTRVQRRDAELLKELGVNLVRTSHYPQSTHFLDRCDELGLLVFEEIPGWQHIGDEAWQDISVQNVEEMILRDYNHPSIILWGVRINESPDSSAFYRRTNETAHRLDTTRQTGGVRCTARGEFQEDVYTFNDFTHSGGEKILRTREEITGLAEPVPLLITESNGHMFPTKRFDPEDRLVEHAMRHLRVLNEALSRSDLVGETSWCAFDYNTHAEFGSGDKICYHGVCDMFRIPKYAGFALMSQRPLAEGAVLEPLSVVSRGEQNGGGLIPIWIATNCDCVRVYKNGVLVGDFFPEHSMFPSLPHPPVHINHLMPQELELPLPEALAAEFRSFIARRTEENILPDLLPEDYPWLEALSLKAGLARSALTDLLFAHAGGWGQEGNHLRFEGIVGGKIAAVREAGEIKAFSHLELLADAPVLKANGDTYDAVRIVVRALDTDGNLCPFYAAGLRIQTDALLSVLGPEQPALIGGCTAFWVRTRGRTGRSVIRVESGGRAYALPITIE